jgi:pyrroloquinoline quinone biosynthesis protein D
MSGRTQRPKLVPWARLRLDPKSGDYVLLYPEKGLLLNATGAQIVKRCTGEYTLAQIVHVLSTEHAGQSRRKLAAETTTFIKQLAERGLLQMQP